MFLALSHLLKDVSIDLSQHAVVLCKSLSGKLYDCLLSTIGLLDKVLSYQSKVIGCFLSSPSLFKR